MSGWGTIIRVEPSAKDVPYMDELEVAGKILGLFIFLMTLVLVLNLFIAGRLDFVFSAIIAAVMEYIILRKPRRPKLDDK